MYRYLDFGYGFQRHQNKPPTSSFPLFGVANVEKNAKKSIFHFQMINHAANLFRSTTFSMELCSKHCISESDVLIGMCYTLLQSLLNGTIGGKFISRRGAISTRRERPTAITVPLVVMRYRVELQIVAIVEHFSLLGRIFRLFWWMLLHYFKLIVTVSRLRTGHDQRTQHSQLRCFCSMNCW